MYNALSVAHYIVDFCNNMQKGISNLKLQKLLYFVQAEFLVSTPEHSPCFKDRIEAWDFGPVILDVYYQYRIFGSSIIPSNQNDPLLEYYDKIDSRHRIMIESVVIVTANYSASQLMHIIHNQTPWKNAFRTGSNREISNDAILKFFWK